MKTIIVCTTSYHPFLGGAEVAIQEIAKRLSGEFRFFIVTARQDRKLSHREVRPEGTVLRIGAGSELFDKWILAFWGGFFIAWKLKFGAWKEAYKNREVLLLGVDISQGALASALASFCVPRVPFVFNLQYGYGDLRLKEGRWGLIQMAFRLMLSRATFATAISRYLFEIARSFGFRGRVEIIPNGVDVEKFTNHESRIKNHERGKKPIIITISRLVEKNGVDILIKAVAEVKKEISDINLHIIGDGPERKNLELLTARYSLQTNITFFGSIPDDDLPPYLHDADIFVRPSRSEGMGNAFLQALVAGLPVVGTPVGGILDIIKDGETGLFAETENPQSVAEKIIMLLNDQKLGERIVAYGRKMAEERFSWGEIAEQYKEVFGSEFGIKKRIMLATPLYPPDIGGPATYSKILMEEMPARGIGIALAYFGDIQRLPKIIRHFAYFLKVCCRARGKDIVFAQDPVSTGFPAMLAAKLLRKKFLLKVVGDYAWEQWQNREPRTTNREPRKFVSPEEFQHQRFGWKTELRKKIEYWVAQSAHTIIVPGDYLKKIVAMWDVSPDKIAVIPNAFDIPEIVETKESARENLRLYGTVIVSAGRLVPWKGFDLLIKLIPRIIEKISDAKLYIIGDGPERKNLELLATRHQLQTNVKFLGAVSHDLLLSYFRAGDIFILNTGYEGLSHVLLEAMAMEIPIVTTNVCGNPELIKNGVEGILADYNDGEGMLNAIALLLENHDLREKMVARAKEKVKQFGLEKMIIRTKEILLQ